MALSDIDTGVDSILNSHMHAEEIAIVYSIYISQVRTCMIGFVTWPPLCKKGVLVIVKQSYSYVASCEICYKLFYAQGVKSIDKLTSWTQLI